MTEAKCAPDETTMANRIDVHSHFLTPDYLAALSKAGIRDVDGYPLPEWSVDAALEAMDRNGVRSSILSISSLGSALSEATTPVNWLGRQMRALVR